MSPKLHKYWYKKNNIDAVYDKKLIKENDVEKLISEVRNKKLDGINVTVPFKQVVISYVDELSLEAKESQSVNTIFRKDNKILGHNTDISGFELAIRSKGYDIKNK